MTFAVIGYCIALVGGFFQWRLQFQTRLRQQLADERNERGRVHMAGSLAAPDDGSSGLDRPFLGSVSEGEFVSPYRTLAAQGLVDPFSFDRRVEFDSRSESERHCLKCGMSWTGAHCVKQGRFCRGGFWCKEKRMAGASSHEVFRLRSPMADETCRCEGCVMDTFPCPRCARMLGSTEVHDDDTCRCQQEINRKSLGQRCGWCGSLDDHKACPALSGMGCPSKTDREKAETALAEGFAQLLSQAWKKANST